MAQQSPPLTVTSSDHSDEWQALTDATYGPTRQLLEAVLLRVNCASVCWVPFS